MITIPIPLNHKLVEFGIAFALVVLLAYFGGGPPKGHHRKR